VSFNEGKTIKDNHRIDLFMETSAKTGFHVEEMFCHAAKVLYELSITSNEVNKVSKIIHKFFITF
jgi:hypothetical protein